MLSYFLLRGKCSECDQRIGWRYPAGELITGVLFAWSWHVWGWSLELGASLFLASILIVISQTDLEKWIILDRVVLPALAVAIVLRWFIQPLPYWQYILGGVVGFGLLWLIAVISRGGMGGGDIKLMAFIGWMIGWQATLLTLFIASLIGLVVGFLLYFIREKATRRQIPFGPFLALGCWLSYLYGAQWIHLHWNWVMDLT